MQKSLCSLPEEDLKAINELAALFFTPREIAVMQEYLENDFIDQCNTAGTPIFKAFHSGRLQSELDLRKAIIKLAKSGSSPAQTMSLDMLKQSKVKMIDR